MNSQINIIDNSVDNIVTNNSTQLNTQISNSSVKPTIENTDYLDKLNEYYQLKNEYESKYNDKKNSILKNPSLNISEKKQKIQKIQKMCISCKRPVKTIFKNTGNYLYAVCGSNNPCGLNIKINKGSSMYLPDLISVFEEAVEENKEDIIKSKLDLLFNFKTENEVITSFNSIKNGLNNDLEALLEYKSSYIQVTENIDNKSLILAKSQLMYEKINLIKETIKEYNEIGEIQLIKDVISLYKDEVLPLVHNLRDLNYKYFHMEDGKLIKKIYTISDLLFFFEEPKIDNFEIKGDNQPSIKDDVSVDFSKLKLTTAEEANIDDTEDIKGFYIQGNKFMFNGKEIADKLNYEDNSQLLNTLQSISRLEANNKGYKFEMLYVKEHTPELFAINPDNGDIFVVELTSKKHHEPKPQKDDINKKPPNSKDIKKNIDAVADILKEQIMPTVRKLPFRKNKPV